MDNNITSMDNLTLNNKQHEKLVKSFLKSDNIFNLFNKSKYIRLIGYDIQSNVPNILILLFKLDILVDVKHGNFSDLITKNAVINVYNAKDNVFKNLKYTNNTCREYLQNYLLKLVWCCFITNKPFGIIYVKCTKTRSFFTVISMNRDKITTILNNMKTGVIKPL